MTFYEAALRVLEAAGHPLHFNDITERSIQQQLLSHVGKTPELTMLSRLLAMARRKTDRKVVVTSKDTFALADWALPEEPDALAQTAASEQREEDNLPPLRPAERHPEPRQENVRVAGRGVERKRRRDEDEDGRRKKKKFPPVPEVVFEILSDEGHALSPRAIAEKAREKGLASDELRDEQILTALLEDNQRRIDAGRRPQFVFDKDAGEVSLERAGAPSEAPPLELQAAFAAALGIPMEGGRPVLPQKGTLPAEAVKELSDAQAALKTAAKDARRAVAKALRRKLGDLDGGTFEKAVVKLLHAEGFRELKVAKRSREWQLLTARKKEGSLELRYAIRVMHGAAQVDRKSVQESRKDAQHHSANVSLLVSAGELRGDARGEAVGSSGLVFLWCAEALAERFLDAEVGVTVSRVESFEIDDRFFDAARADAEEAAKRREERQREKKRDEPRRDKDKERDKDRDRDREKDKDRAPRAAEGTGAAGEGAEEAASSGETETSGEGAAPATGASERAPARAPQAASGSDDEDDGDEEEGEDDLEAAEAFVGGKPGAEGGEGAEAGANGERKRRRRRRRGRRGRGAKNGEGSAQAAPGTEGAQGEASAEGDAPAPVPAASDSTGGADAAASAVADATPSAPAEPERVASDAPPPPSAPAVTASAAPAQPASEEAAPPSPPAASGEGEGGAA